MFVDWSSLLTCRMIAQLEHLSEVYLVPAETSSSDYFLGMTRAIDHNTDTILVGATYLKQLMLSSSNEGEEGMLRVNCRLAAKSCSLISISPVTVAEGRERLDYEFLEPISRLSGNARTSKTAIKKMLRRLEDLSEQALTIRPEYLANFKDMYSKSSRIARLCNQVSSWSPCSLLFPTL
jgi:dynactin 1